MNDLRGKKWIRITVIVVLLIIAIYLYLTI